MDDKEPEKLSSLLQGLSARLGSPLKIAPLFSSWPEIVGDAVASRCSPVALREGVFKLRAHSAAWAKELKYLAPEVIRRVNAHIGEELVRDLQIVVERPRSSDGQKGR